MQGVDDLIDESVWVNVQDPVRQMITAITKAVRTQSAGIRDLDRKVSGLVTTDILDRVVHANISKVSTKGELKDMAREMDARTNELSSNFSNYEERLGDISTKLSKMNELLNNQSIAITNLNSRVERITEDIEDVRLNPNYDAIYAYIDRQVQHVANDFTRKLGAKIDQQVFDASIPQQLKDTLSQLNKQVEDIKSDIRKNIATKSDVLELHSTKASAEDVHALAADLSTKMNQFEVNQVLTNQINPLVTAMSAMEKVIAIQSGDDDVSKRGKNGRGLRGFGANAHEESAYSSSIAPLTVDKVYHMIDEYVHQHHLGDVTPVRVDTALAQHTEHVLREAQALCNAARVELVVENKEAMHKMLGVEVKDKIRRLEAAAQESSDAHKKSKTAMKQLASNVAKALATKASVEEMKVQFEQERHCYRNNTNPMDNERRSRSVDRTPLEERSSRTHVNVRRSTSGSGRYSYYSDEENDSGSSNVNIRNRGTGDDIRLRRVNDELKLDLNQIDNTVRTLKSFTEGLKGQIDAELLTIRTQMEQRLSASESLMRLEKNSSATMGMNDWRIALGETSMNLRRELSTKMNREEVVSYVRGEVDILDKKLLAVEKDVENKASIVCTNQIESDILLIRNKIAGELTGGRWLWTTGQLSKGVEGMSTSLQSGGMSSTSSTTNGASWIPWDTEVVNAAPAILCWKRGVTSIKTRMAGLYRITICIFTSMPCAIQLCLNGEPIITLQPDISNHSAMVSGASMLSGGGGGNNRSALVADER